MKLLSEVWRILSKLFGVKTLSLKTSETSFETIAKVLPLEIARINVSSEIIEWILAPYERMFQSIKVNMCALRICRSHRNYSSKLGVKVFTR